MYVLYRFMRQCVCSAYTYTYTVVVMTTCPPTLISGIKHYVQHHDNSLNRSTFHMDAFTVYNIILYYKIRLYR